MHSQKIPSWLETFHEYWAMHCVLWSTSILGWKKITQDQLISSSHSTSHWCPMLQSLYSTCKSMICIAILCVYRWIFNFDKFHDWLGCLAAKPLRYIYMSISGPKVYLGDSPLVAPLYYICNTSVLYMLWAMTSLTIINTLYIQIQHF